MELCQFSHSTRDTYVHQAQRFQIHVLLGMNILYLMVLLEGRWSLQKIQRKQCAEVMYVLQSKIKISFYYTQNRYKLILFCSV